MASAMMKRTVRGKRTEIVITTALAVSPPCSSLLEMSLIVSWIVDWFAASELLLSAVDSGEPDEGVLGAWGRAQSIELE